MQEQASCGTCCFWIRLRSGAVVGGCRNSDSEFGYSNADDWCAHWQRKPTAADRPVE